jgi:putative hydrolase of the HAD superfamily
MKRPRAILFDLDNTLVDRDAAMRQVMRLWLAEHAPALPADQREAALDEIMAYDRHGYTPRQEFCEWLAAQRSKAGDVWRFISEHIAHQVRPQPSVQALLANLRDRYALALVSNGGSDTQRRKLRRAQLETYFGEHVFISGEFGAAKPEAAIFEAALDSLAIGPRHALFVGDDLARDIAGAAAVGMATCRVGRYARREATRARPDLAVERVEQLLEHLAPKEASCTT